MTAWSSAGRRGFDLIVVATLLLGIVLSWGAPTFAQPDGQASALALLEELPWPSLDAEEPQVRGQLESGRTRLAESLASVRERADTGSIDPISVAVLAESFAELGRLFYLYQMLDAAEVALSNALVLAPDATEWRYIRAVARSLDGAQEAAVDELLSIIDVEPRNAAARVRAGDLLYDLARYEEAKRQFEAAIGIDPTAAAAWAGLGQVAARNKEHERAVEYLRKALELQPSADALNYPLAQSLRQLGDTTAARAALALHRQGVVTMADPVLDGLNNSNQSSLALLHAGNSAMRRGEMKQAAGYFRRFILRQPDHAVATHNLGLVLMADQKREEGLAKLRRAVELDPDFRGGHYFLAAVLAEDGLFDEAIGHYRRAHEIDPLEQTIHADYAALMASMGNIEQALAELEPIVREDPDAHYVRLKYATILAVAGRGAQAQPLLEQMSAADMEASLRAEALYHLGLLNLRSERFEEAQDLLEESVELGPGSGPANAALAQLLGRAGDLSGAARHFSRALKAQPTDEKAHFGLAMALLLSDRDMEARQALDLATQVLPEHRPLRHLLARVLAASSDSDARDGRRALALAQSLVAEEPSVQHAETLAMAFAEVGQFDEAVRWQQRALARGPQAPGAAQQGRARLQDFEQGRAVRDPWEAR